MNDRVLYPEFLKGSKSKSRTGDSDPRLEAMVRFLARRAAERDYSQFLRDEKHKKNKKKEIDD